MKKNVKIFSSETDTAEGRFPLNSLVIIARNTSEKAVGTVVDKTGVTNATTAKQLIDNNKIVLISHLHTFEYDETKSSLSVKL